MTYLHLRQHNKIHAIKQKQKKSHSTVYKYAKCVATATVFCMFI